MLPPKSRIPIWKALSEFYLDTELQESDYLRIARILKDSDLSLEELKDIDLYEVFPTFQANLNSIPGEWTGFEEGALIEACKNNFQKRGQMAFRLGVRLKNKVFYSMRSRHWNEIKIMMEII